MNYFFYFLFLLIRKILFEKRVLNAKDHKVAKMYKQKEKQKHNHDQGKSKSINNGRESLDVSPQAQDQSNRETINKSRS